MIAVIYRLHLKPHQEAAYIKNWKTVASYFKQYRQALGSTLHRGADGLWVVYSRWPDEQTRQASWPGDDAPSDTLPDAVRQAITDMQALKTENSDLEQYDDICLEIVEDFLNEGERHADDQATTGNRI